MPRSSLLGHGVIFGRQCEPTVFRWNLADLGRLAMLITTDPQTNSAKGEIGYSPSSPGSPLSWWEVTSSSAAEDSTSSSSCEPNRSRA